jgi:transporter family protein
LGRAFRGLRGLTAIFAKIGIAGVNSDMATRIRTLVILGVLSAFMYATGK